MNNKEKGNYGENLVENYMKRNNYNIIGKNYRLGKKEIDIVALKEKVIVFVEVKLRNSRFFGRGFEALNRTKRKNIIQAAQAYILNHHYKDFNIRFDVASIDEGKLTYIKDAFNLNY